MRVRALAGWASHEIGRMSRVIVTTVALRVVLLCNRHQDELLSHFLHRLADGYSRRPTGAWEREPDGSRDAPHGSN